MATILVVEDDINLNYIVCSKLRSVNYEVESTEDPMEAFAIMDRTQVDLIVTDIMMPQMDGFELARQVRRINREIPIIFMTAKDDIESKQRGFDIGIDDYLVKPVNLQELVMRVGSLLRRARIFSHKKVEVGKLCMLKEETTAYYDGEDLHLTVKEFGILYKLLTYPRKTFTRNQLMDEFWGYDNESLPRTVDVTMMKLRNKISGCSEIKIATVRGLGYKGVIVEDEGR